ncbi:MAG: exopolysaccharide biosynthesis polyprenyl glycosylphosphotransferase [Pseudomonadota bacterium]
MSETRVPSPGTATYRPLPAEHGRARLSSSPLRMCTVFLTMGQVLAILAAGAVAKFVYIDLLYSEVPSFLLYLPVILVLPFIVCVAFHRMGLEDYDVLTGPSLNFGTIIGGLALSFLILLGGLYLLKTAEIYSRGWIICWFALSIIAVITARWSITRWIRQMANAGMLQTRTALFGTATQVELLKSTIQKSSPHLSISGIYIDDQSSSTVSNNGGLRELQRSVARGTCDRVIICLPDLDPNEVVNVMNAIGSGSQEILLCRDLAAAPVPLHGSRSVGNIRADIVAPVPASENNIVLKRLLDVTAATAALIALSPIMLLVAIAIKLDSPGPVFFRQRRYGRNDDIFRIFKFRSMTVTEDGASIEQAKRNDSRVTRVGRIIRATSIDELPQLINVLFGQMSIVGPRPHALAHDRKFEQQLDLFSRRRRVLPGITGWAQVNGYRGETKTLSDIRRRMDLDLYYVDKWSIWLDIEIMVRTVVTVVRGAY